MYKVVFLIGAFILSTVFSLTTVTYANNNLTSPGFMIDLAKIDPVTQNKDIPTGEAGLRQLLGNIANLLLFSIPIIAGVSFLIAGYYYILSGGDSEKATKAKTIIKWNLIAIVIALSSYLIISLIGRILSGTL